MATSGTYTYQLTAQQLVNAILRWLPSVLESGGSADSEETQDVIEAINLWMLQQMGPERVGKFGQMLWLVETDSIPLTAGQEIYQLKPTGGDLDIQVPTSIMSASLRNGDGEDTLLIGITRGEYELITKKSYSGSPLYYYYQKLIDTGLFYVYPSPDADAASSTIRVVYRQPIEMITSPSQTLDIEPYFYRALRFNVALDIASEFDVEPTQNMTNQAVEAMAILNSFFPEDYGENVFFERES